ncbi:hypothetical protein TNIN_228631 [Trichonephila inaurata madagascariensis]|uniref:Uncharacterized protein n=1 Tax=Trichonephila inaurata madagascariensis TaxID=2747483 RepID=A0A8X6YK92_9ARAC|nr:hypothetical protein TNIN_228631 [Trichonephila inaurata madagascariensis]
MESKPVPSQEKWYHDMLRYFVIPQLQQHAGLHHITFMLSGAPPHHDPFLRQISPLPLPLLVVEYPTRQYLPSKASKSADLMDSIQHHVLDFWADLFQSSVEYIVLRLEPIF